MVVVLKVHFAIELKVKLHYLLIKELPIKRFSVLRVCISPGSAPARIGTEHPNCYSMVVSKFAPFVAKRVVIQCTTQMSELFDLVIGPN